MSSMTIKDFSLAHRAHYDSGCHGELICEPGRIRCASCGMEWTLEDYDQS